MPIHPLIEYNFNEKSKSSGAWTLQALRMKLAADVIFDRFVAAGDRCISGQSTSLDEAGDLELIMPASLLYGLALENALKAQIIKQKYLSLDDMKPLFAGSTGHNLSVLAQMARIRLSKKERDLSNRLSAYVVWAGKYPVPKSAEKMAIQQLGIKSIKKKTIQSIEKTVEVKQPWFPMPMCQHERPLFNNLFNRAMRTLGHLMRYSLSSLDPK